MPGTKSHPLELSPGELRWTFDTLVRDPATGL